MLKANMCLIDLHKFYIIQKLPCEPSTSSHGSYTIIYIKRGYFLTCTGFIPSCVGVTCLINPFPLNSILSIHTSRL